MNTSRVDEDRSGLVLAALERLRQEGCPAVPDDVALRTGLAHQLIRRFDSVGRRHRRVDDRTRFLDLARAVDAHPRDAECVAERTMAALGHPVPGMGIHGIGNE